MKEKNYVLSVILAVIMTVAMVTVVLFKTFAPAVILPAMNIPNMAGLSVLALLIEYFIAPKGRRCYVCVAGFALLAFGLLPLVAGYIAPAQVWKVALIGCALFTLLTWLYDSILDRLSTGPKAKLAPVVCALGLYLTFQIFAGILL